MRSAWTIPAAPALALIALAPMLLAGAAAGRTPASGGLAVQQRTPAGSRPMETRIVPTDRSDLDRLHNVLTYRYGRAHLPRMRHRLVKLWTAKGASGYRWRVEDSVIIQQLRKAIKRDLRHRTHRTHKLEVRTGSGWRTAGFLAERPSLFRKARVVTYLHANSAMSGFQPGSGSPAAAHAYEALARGGPGRLRGIGTLLLADAMRRAHEQGKPLRVKDATPEAQPFYEKLGLSYAPGFHRSTDQAVNMQLDAAQIPSVLRRISRAYDTAAGRTATSTGSRPPDS